MFPRKTEHPSDVRVAILAKAPVAGLAKTRLIPHLGADGAAALQRWLLQRTVATAVGAGLPAVRSKTSSSSSSCAAAARAIAPAPSAAPAATAAVPTMVSMSPTMVRFMGSAKMVCPA